MLALYKLCLFYELYRQTKFVNISNYVRLTAIFHNYKTSLPVTIKTSAKANKTNFRLQKIKKVAERSVNRRRLIAKLNWRYQK